VGVLGHVGVGEAKYPPALEAEFAVAPSVGSEGLAGRVWSEAVELDYEAVLAPEVVGTKGSSVGQDHPFVHCRLGKAGSAYERQEALLGLALGERGAGRVLDEARAEEGSAGSASALRDLPLERFEVEEPELLRSVERALKLSPRHDIGQVQERARHARDRYAVSDNDVE